MKKAIKLTEELITEANQLIDKYTDLIIEESSEMTFTDLLKDIRNCKYSANDHERKLVEQIESKIAQQALNRKIKD